MHLSQKEREDPIKVEIISFEDALPLWQKLWPGRDTIASMSSMLYLFDSDTSIYDKYDPSFFGVYDKETLIACNSGHPTSDKEYRSRGLYVDPAYRNLGIATELLKVTCEYAKYTGYRMIWTCPRKGSQHVYYRVGFKRTSEWMNEGMLYGPNCYAMKEL